MSDLESEYRQRLELVLRPLAGEIERQLQEYFQNEQRIDRVTTRANDVVPVV
jgi:hypothetical protein